MWVCVRESGKLQTSVALPILEMTIVDYPVATGQ